MLSVRDDLSAESDRQASSVGFSRGSMTGKAIVVALLAAASAVQAQTTGAIDPVLARRYFEDLRQLGVADNGRLWGKRVDGPVMFVDAAARVMVANEADSKGLLHEESGVWVGKLPESENPANTAVDLGGKRWSMVLWPLSDSRYARQRLLMHESFHRMQNDIGLPMTNPANAHLATAEGRIWTRLEWRALTEALLRSGTARRQALTDALIFRARRRAIAPKALEDERLLEMNEGLAEYTGLVLSGLPRSALNDRAAVQLAQSEPQESFVRSFAYASGPAYALLLDASRIPWRRKLRASDDLSELTRRAYGIAAVDNAHADKLIDRYAGARMIADEKEREKKRVENEARIRSEFMEGPRLRLPVAGAFSFSFDPNGAVPIAGVGTYYQSSRITDSWGALEVESGGVLMERRPDGAITAVVVPRPVVSEGKISGAGWTLTLAPGWSAVEGQRKGELTLKSP